MSLCELAMNLSSHQIIVIWKERSSSDMPVNLILIFFQVHQNYLVLSVNLRSVLICYTTLSSAPFVTCADAPVEGLVDYSDTDSSSDNSAHPDSKLWIRNEIAKLKGRYRSDKTWDNRVNTIIAAIKRGNYDYFDQEFYLPPRSPPKRTRDDAELEKGQAGPSSRNSAPLEWGVIMPGDSPDHGALDPDVQFEKELPGVKIEPEREIDPPKRVRRIEGGSNNGDEDAN